MASLYSDLVDKVLRRRWDRMRPPGDELEVIVTIVVHDNDSVTLFVRPPRLLVNYVVGGHRALALAIERCLCVSYPVEHPPGYLLGKTQIALAEVPAVRDTGVNPAPGAICYDVIVGVVPSPHAVFPQRVSITIRRAIDGSLVESWSLAVSPGSPVVPFYKGRYPFPMIAMTSTPYYTLDIQCPGLKDDDENRPRLLCGVIFGDGRDIIATSRPSFPGAETFCLSRFLEGRPDLELPDLDHLMCESQRPQRARACLDMIRKELMERAWAPDRVAKLVEAGSFDAIDL